MKRLLALLLLVPVLAFGQANFTKCADEGGRCLFTGTKLVRYGQPYISWTTPREFTGGVQCDNATFSSFWTGNAKWCEMMDTATPAPSPACTTPQPAADTQTVQCPTGTTGTWSQSRAYSTASYPTCWAAGAWTPASAPAGACTAVVVPPPAPPPVALMVKPICWPLKFRGTVRDVPASLNSPKPYGGVWACDTPAQLASYAMTFGVSDVAEYVTGIKFGPDADSEFARDQPKEATDPLRQPFSA